MTEYVRNWCRALWLTITSAIRELSALNAEFSELQHRIAQSPGLPRSDATTSFWLRDPPFPNLDQQESANLPESADIVVIGSGITGAAIARALLTQSAEKTPRIVMLEARGVCSAATGRNGGHLKATPYAIYGMCRRAGLTPSRSAAIVTFQLQTAKVLLKLGLDYPASETRALQTVDFFLTRKAFDLAKAELADLASEMPGIAAEVQVHDAEETAKLFHCGRAVLGSLSYTAGAMWPYRFVTSILDELLSMYTQAFSLHTATPVTNIMVNGGSNYPYTVVTSGGQIRAQHIVHATNGYTSNLVRGLRSSLFPCRGQMTAQRPGSDFPSALGLRSWGFIGDTGFEYITQRPPSAYPAQSETDQTIQSGGEILLGGAFMLSGLSQLGLANDTKLDTTIGAYLEGIMPLVFDKQHWGSDAPGGRVIDHWTGVMGFTLDTLPYVGRLPYQLTGRTVKATSLENDYNLASSGEWIAAGYNGEGMVNAWSCGVAVADMILQRSQHSEDVPALPKEYIITNQRLARSSLAQMSRIWQA